MRTAETTSSLHPASIGQQIWARHYMRSISIIKPFFWTSSLHISGQLFEEVLEHSMSLVVARHEALRTSLQVQGGAICQRVMPPAARPLALLDLSGIEKSDRETAALAAVSRMARSRFLLDCCPLFRASLLRLAQDEHVLAITACEAICDGPSRTRWLGEIMEYYQTLIEGGLPSPRPLQKQYRDFAIWQRKRLELPDTQLQRKHWAAYAISQRETCMSLSDRRGTRVRSFDAGQIEFTIEAKVRSQLEQIARQHDATLFIILAASLGVLLHLTTGSSQVAIGSTSDYREPSAFEDVVGMFVSSFTLPLNITPDSSFLQVLQLARHSAILAYQCRDYPLDLVLQELYPDRDLYLQPPFDLKLVLQDERSYLPAESGLNIMPFGPSNAQARHDMTVAVAARDDGLAVTATYSTDQFGPAQAAITMQTWQLLLFQVATSPNSRVSEIGQRVVTTPLGC